VRILCAALGAVALATAVGLAVLWPRDRVEAPPTLAGQLTTQAAEVVAVGPGPCEGAPEQTCPGADIEVTSGPDRSFSDFERRVPLVALGIAFAVLVLLVARWQGLRSLVGLALSLAVVLFFIVPAIPVSTLVLAYVGAALPTFLIFSLAGVPLGQALNSEVVAVEVVAMLAGSIGLIAAVPITTWIAAVMAVRMEPGPVVAGGHAH
jgi:YibE/F-like protein